MGQAIHSQLLSPGFEVDRNVNPGRATEYGSAALSGLADHGDVDPGLTPWANICRRFAAGNTPSRLRGRAPHPASGTTPSVFDTTWKSCDITAIRRVPFNMK